MDDLYAFWDYDICPYILWGKIESFTDRGLVVIKGRPGYAFEAITILPGEAGIATGKRVDALWAEYRQKSKALKAEYSGAVLLSIGINRSE